MSNKTNSSGMSILSLLGIAFVVLKLCNVINWSWWWVTSPFWGIFAIGIVFLIIYLLISFIQWISKQ